MKKLVIIGIVGSMFLTSFYVMAQPEPINPEPANPKLGAAPESDKNIGPGPNDATIGSDKKPTNRRNPKDKTQRSGAFKRKGQSPAPSGGRTTEAPGG